MISIHIITTDTISWNSHVNHPMQSWEWGTLREAEGKAVVRFVCSSHPEQRNGSHQSATIDSVFQMTIHPIPHTGYSIGYIPKSSLPPTEFLHHLKSYCLTHRILFVKFELCELATTNLKFEISDVVASSHPLFTPWNQVLDISQSEDVLLAAMHPKTRYNIKLAAKRGVTISKMSSDEGYMIFEKLYFDTTKRQRYRGHLPAYHRNIWEHLKAKSHESSADSQQSGLNGELSTAANSSKLKAHILVASYHGEPLAVFQLWHFKDTMYYVYGGSSTEHKSVMAPNLLMWEAIHLAKSLGCNLFDMWGSLPPEHDSADPWAGFTRFKSGYGTQFVQYAGSYDLIVYPLLYRLYSLVQTIRTKML